MSMLKIRRTKAFITTCFLCWLIASPSTAQTVDFNFDIRPLLSDRCYVCHGPDEENREAELRLDSHESAFGEAQSGNADRIIQPGDAEASELYLRVVSDDPDMVMPPADSELKLNDHEKDLVRRWINEGASWKSHWSFLPIPAVTAPRAPLHQRIDAAIRHRLQGTGLKLGEPADPRTLLRRLTLDLTGLPPTPEEVARYLADESPTAYERVVDRLLASPRFGERMASVWLDAARYSDTYGYQVDRDRFVWPYRDWVVRQFNANLPYDEFLVQQLAGDLLPDATDEQILATTFNRLHPQKVEGGSVPEEFRIEYVADRTQTFATAMLGLTLECAKCHDHKYDPITQREYYQLTAFFDNIDEAGLYSYFTSSVPTPTLLLGDDDFKQRKAELQQEVASAWNALQRVKEQARMELENAGSAKSATVSLPTPIETVTFDDWKPNGKNEQVDGVRGRAAKLSGDDAVTLKQGNFHRYQPFSISLWANVPEHRERSVIFHRSRAWTDAGSRGYECLIKDGHLTASLIHFWPGNAISIRTTEKLPTKQWHHILLTYDGSSQAGGLRLYLNGQLARTEMVRDNLYKEITGGGGDTISIGERFRDVGFKHGLVDEFMVFDRELLPVEARMLHRHSSDVELSQADHFQLSLRNNEAHQKALTDLQATRKALCDLQQGVQEIMVMRESSQPRPTYFLRRGVYSAKGDEVGRLTPAALPPMPDDLPRNRWGLAKWLVSAEHPLTARVAANRLWQTVFGSGLVRTPEDFGSQGELPTHPELLDELASEFIAMGWNTKRLVKQMVLSQVYRQSSQVSAEQLEKDPENRLYARAPSYRWPAETLRDQALFAGGLLVEKQGGAPVKPYDLQHSFKPMTPDTGAGLYRRSLYTYWKRTGPSPAMMALDASKRDVCRVKRSRTSSPLQVLVLMNGPQFVEAARQLAENAIRQHDRVEERINDMFERLTSRPPTAAETRVLQQLYEQQWDRFQAQPEATAAYLKVGAKPPPPDITALELATATSVANALFGLDEVMMKR